MDNRKSGFPLALTLIASFCLLLSPSAIYADVYEERSKSGEVISRYKILPYAGLSSDDSFSIFTNDYDYYSVGESFARIEEYTLVGSSLRGAFIRKRRIWYKLTGILNPTTGQIEEIYSFENSPRFYGDSYKKISQIISRIKETSNRVDFEKAYSAFNDFYHSLGEIEYEGGPHNIHIWQFGNVRILGVDLELNKSKKYGNVFKAKFIE